MGDHQKPNMAKEKLRKEIRASEKLATLLVRRAMRRIAADPDYQIRIDGPHPESRSWIDKYLEVPQDSNPTCQMNPNDLVRIEDDDFIDNSDVVVSKPKKKRKPYDPDKAHTLVDSPEQVPGQHFRNIRYKGEFGDFVELPNITQSHELLVCVPRPGSHAVPAS